MAGRPKNPLDPMALAQMFADGDFASMFDPGDMKAFDGLAMLDAQQKNLAALTAAQEAAAAAYKDLFDKQVEVFESTMRAAHTGIEAVAKAGDPAAMVAKQTELTQDAYKAAAENAAELAEMARKANEEAFRIMLAQIEKGAAGQSDD